MPNPIADLDSYKAGVNTTVTTQTTVNSIDPVAVGSIGTDLADLLLPYLQSINNQGYSQGTSIPSDLVGDDLNLYYQQLIAGFSIWRKENGVWIQRITMAFVIVEDGILSGLRTFIEGVTVTVSSGTWSISNIRYSKATQTQFTVPNADANWMRYDLIYATNAGTILYLAGTASSSPIYPNTPANSVVVDYVIVPSVASTSLPYLLSGGGNLAIIPTLQQVTTAGNSTSNAIQVTGFGSFGAEDSLAMLYNPDTNIASISIIDGGIGKSSVNLFPDQVSIHNGTTEGQLILRNETGLISGAAFQGRVGASPAINDNDLVTKGQVADVIGKVQIPRTEADLIEDVDNPGSWYLEYKIGSSTPVEANTKPYCVQTMYDDPDNPGTLRTEPVSPFLYNKQTWSFPRIYGFPDPSTEQTITIYAI